MLVSVSILSCKKKEPAIRKINFTSADFLHIDFMDGKFTPKKSFKIKEIKKISEYSTKKLDIHLMVKKPKKYIKKLSFVNANYLTFHIEAGGKKTKSLLELIKSYGIKAGLAISPSSDISILEDYIEDVDLILLMSVVPGMGGQSFLEETPKRLEELEKLCEKYHVSPIISVDGGINQNTKDLVSTSNMLVAGTYITNNDNFEQAILNLKKTK